VQQFITIYIVTVTINTAAYSCTL